MAVVMEGIRAGENNTLSFGNYSVKEKMKVNDFEFGGDVYKVRTHDKVTRLEKNDELLIEAVPGAAFHNFKMSEKVVSFDVEGIEDCQITIGLEPEKEYKLMIDDVQVGKIVASRSGKLNFSLELDQDCKKVMIEKM